MSPITGLMPDADPNTPGIFIACSNVIPFESGYRGAPSGVSANVSALAGACIGAVVATKLDGSRRVFAGTATDLYELSGTTWTSRTRTPGVYTGGTDTRWSFCQFGDTTVAANLADTIQSSATGQFQNITGAPRAKIVVSASNNFVIAFNTVDSTYGTNSNRWWCCAQNDQTSWTPNVATLCATGQLIAGEGAITAALPLGSYVIAYKQKGVFLGQFSGAPEVWNWQPMPGGEAGCVGQEAVCDIGGAHFFVSNDNFWIFDGTRPTAIGDGVIRQWFLNNSSAQYRYRTQCSFDKQNKIVRIFYPSATSNGARDACLVVHVGASPFRWGMDDRVVEAPLFYIAPGATINSLDNYSATIDALPNIPVDSQYWAAGGQVAAYFDTTHTILSLNGPTRLSSIILADTGDDDQVTMIERVRVRFTKSPTTATATGFYKFNEGDNLTQGATSSLNDGKFDLRQSGRFHRVRVDMTGDHKETGYDVKLITSGVR